VGASVALMSAAAGLFIGLLTGYLRWLDGVVMRVMDGLMSIPAILLAIALMSLSSAGLRTVIIAIVIPAVPGVVRLVRSVVLSIREEPYVEAAIALGVPTRTILRRHVLPNALAPLIRPGHLRVRIGHPGRGTLSFLGIGIPPQIPTWGQHHGGGADAVRVFPHNILFPGVFLAVTILAGQYAG
jgi:peptide/nickel transport system permease protein